MNDVTIIGGGFAGLAAAVALADQGIKVSLFERRPLLGGRAYSVKDSTTGDTIDNGQHLMMGCYHHTLRFLEKIGTLSKVEFQPRMEVHFADPQGNNFRLKCPNLPSPFHLLGGLIGLKSLNLSEKWAMIQMMRKVRSLNDREFEQLDQLSAHQWLTLLGQPEETIKNFWEPLILATLNELPTLSSAQMLAVVIREALLKEKENSRMVLSKVGLSDLYTEAAKNFVEERGGKIFIKRGLAKIVFSPSPSTGEGWGEGDSVEKIILEDGTEHKSQFYISAIPPDSFTDLLSEEIQNHSFFNRFKNFKFSPILSINLWFDRPILKETFVGFLDSPIHWVFNKGMILNTDHPLPNPLPSREREKKMDYKGHYISLVISGAHELKDESHEKLLAVALKALHQSFPHSKEATLKHHRILKELKATPSFGIGSNELRPEPITPIHNLFLAGDWTATGLPATIEGAVKSGNKAAELILQKIR
jgi:squalene-associated FAD-dependent desaturase